jgi:hypothetical protein
MAQFTRRFSQGSSRFEPDDSRRESEVRLEDCCLIDDLYIIGAYPWEADTRPRVLYSAVEVESASSSLARFVLPGGCKSSTNSFSSSPEYLSSLFGPYATPTAGQLVHYFPATRSYLFFYRFTINPLTIPSLAHDFSLAELVSHMTPTSYPTCEMVLAFKTKAPFPDLFAAIARWILQEESVSRLTTFPHVERFLDGLLPIGEMWPSEHRERLQTEITGLVSLLVPRVGECVSICPPNFESLSWRRPSVGEPDDELARSTLAVVFRTFKPKTLAVVFSALLLERSIVIYHTQEAVVNRVILALHLLLKPLRWVSCSVSLLPPDLADVLQAPTPVLVGVTLKQRSFQPGVVYVDLMANSIISSTGRVPVVPKQAGLERDLARLWRGIGDPTGRETAQLLGMANGIVAGFLKPVKSSIVTDFSDLTEMHSKFFPELYLKQFAMAERSFAEAFAGTQMFRLYVEQECRRRSEEMRRGA